jgi:hypothetical protein
MFYATPYTGFNPIVVQKGIRLVGYKTLEVAGSAGTQNISITGLTGGLGRDPQSDDVVVIGWGHTSATDRNLAITGYVEVADLYQNDTWDSNLGVFLKVLTAADTTAELSATEADRWNTIVVFVWSGVDLSTPQDAAATTAGNTNEAEPNPASITPVTVGAVVVAIAHNSEDTNGTPPHYAPSDLSNFIQCAHVNAGLHSTVTGGGWTGPWASGAVNPGDWNYTGNGTSSPLNSSWNAVTLALRPA